MSAPRVSVLINNFNYADFVAQAVESALNQRDVPVEVIVVDDGSTDASRAILQRYEGSARTVFQENGGQATAINAGVQESRGDILCFLDSDDWWAPGKAAAMVRAFDADPGVVLAYHRLRPVDREGQEIGKPIPRTLCGGDITGRLARSAGWWPFPMTSSVAVRRSAFERVGPIPETLRISADAWLVGIYPFLGRVAALPEVLGYYRIHQNNWHRTSLDRAALEQRADHWRRTVDLSNRFLEREGMGVRLCRSDHFPLRAAETMLSGASLVERVSLMLAGLRFAGEPHPLRRARDAMRAALAPPLAM